MVWAWLDWGLGTGGVCGRVWTYEDEGERGDLELNLLRALQVTSERAMAGCGSGSQTTAVAVALLPCLVCVVHPRSGTFKVRI